MMMVTQLGQCVIAAVQPNDCHGPLRVRGQLVNPNYGSAGRPLQEPLSELPEQAQEVAHARPTLHLVISSPHRRFLHLADLIFFFKKRSLTPASSVSSTWPGAK